MIHVKVLESSYYGVLSSLFEGEKERRRQRRLYPMVRARLIE